MSDPLANSSPRYHRQMQFAAFGPAGQRRLRDATVLIVGLGGLGSYLSELLCRAGLGRLRLVDDDRVDWTNLARQAMYEEADARDDRPKVFAASARLGRINTEVEIQTHQTRLTAANARDLAAGVDLICDGTDDWATRFLLNDLAVDAGTPWVWAGVVRAEGQVLAIRPGLSACLRCVFEDPPPAELEQANKASAVGVLGSAVSTIASIAATEAIKLLTLEEGICPGGLVKLDLWRGTFQNLTPARREDCPCCVGRQFPFLDA